MRGWLAVIAVVATGCAAAMTPELTWPEPAAKEALGSPIWVHGSWGACEHVEAGLLEHGDGHYKCKTTAATVTIACDRPCSITPDGADSANVRANQLGPLAVSAIVERVDTGERHVETRSYEIVMPDRIALECLDELGTQRMWAPCERGVMATRPTVRAQAFLGNRELGTTIVGLRINGAAVPPGGEVSLAELFPDRRAARGVERGTYEVEVGFEEVTNRVTVVAE